MSSGSVAGGAGPRTDRAGLAVGFILVATFTMALQDAVVKLFSTELTLWQLFTLRSLMVIPLLIVLAAVTGSRRAIWPRRIVWAFLRGMLLVGMYVAFYAALPLLPISTVAAAYYTGPLFIVLFAGLILGERVGLRRAGCIAVGFAGVLVILQPGTDAFSFALMVPIVSAVLYALAAILTRSRCANEGPIALSMALNVGFVLCGLAGTLALSIWEPSAEEVALHPFLFGAWVTPDWRAWSVLILLALASLCIHLCLARAYQAASPQVVASFDYAYLLFAAGWGYLLLGETPGLATVFGMAMIAGAGLLILLLARRAPVPD